MVLTEKKKGPSLIICWYSSYSFILHSLGSLLNPQRKAVGNVGILFNLRPYAVSQIRTSASLIHERSILIPNPANRFILDPWSLVAKTRILRKIVDRSLALYSIRLLVELDVVSELIWFRVLVWWRFTALNALVHDCHLTIPLSHACDQIHQTDSWHLRYRRLHHRSQNHYLRPMKISSRR